MKIVRVLLVFFTLSQTCLSQTPNPPLKKITKEQWQEDIDFFAAQMVKKHGNAFHYTSKEIFNNAIFKLVNDLPSLQDHQVVVRLQQIAASIGDAHTYVKLPSDFKRYPLVFYWFGKELYVVRATGDHKELMGTRLVSIGGHSLDEIRQKIESILSNDENESFRLFNGPNYMAIPEILQTLGIVSTIDQASFSFLDKDNKTITKTITPITVTPGIEWLSPVANEPLFRQKMNEGYWFSYLEDVNAVYVNFKSYDKLNMNVSALFDFINEKNAKSLIIDMRQNGGGDYTKVRKLLIPAIQENKDINQADHLFVISGRRTFSAAMNNVIDFKKQTAAIIVGEAPGEKPNSWQEGDEFRLPNSGLTVSYSTKFYKFLNEDSPSFEPDIKIEPNWNDFINGIDPVLEQIKKMIRKN